MCNTSCLSRKALAITPAIPQCSHHWDTERSVSPANTMKNCSWKGAPPDGLCTWFLQVFPSTNYYLKEGGLGVQVQAHHQWERGINIASIEDLLQLAWSRENRVIFRILSPILHIRLLYFVCFRWRFTNAGPFSSGSLAVGPPSPPRNPPPLEPLPKV